MLLVIVVLVLLNGFFVGAEFALVRSRRTRLEALVRAGDARARRALRAVSNIPRLLSASQVGVTLASLGLGWMAATVFGLAVEQLPARYLDAQWLVLVAVLVLLLVSFLHVVFGELVPRAMALAYPEGLARWLGPFLAAFAWLATPLTALFSRTSNLVLRLFGQGPSVDEEVVHSPEELRMLVEQSHEEGMLEQQDADLIEGVFEFSEKNAREVMTPRTEIVALEVDASLDEVVAVVEESGLSRFPVYEESIDNIVGLVLAKDLLRVLRHPPPSFSLRALMRNVHFLPGSREVEEVLADFKRLKEHLAVVLDEYGGTAGIVTMEDLLEEIVGEILDEYDEPEEAAPAVGGGEVLVTGTTHIGELNERYGLSVPEEDYTTVGGFVFGTLGRLPVIGDRVIAGNAVFTVREMEGRRIEVLSVDLHSAGDRRGLARDEHRAD